MFYKYNNSRLKYNPYYKNSSNYNYNPISTKFNYTINILVHLQQQYRLIKKDNTTKLYYKDYIYNYTIKLKNIIITQNKQIIAIVEKNKDQIVYQRVLYLENIQRYK